MNSDKADISIKKLGMKMKQKYEEQTEYRRLPTQILVEEIEMGHHEPKDMMPCMSCHKKSTYQDWIEYNGYCPNCGHDGWSITL